MFGLPGGFTPRPSSLLGRPLDSADDYPMTLYPPLLPKAFAHHLVSYGALSHSLGMLHHRSPFFSLWYLAVRPPFNGILILRSPPTFTNHARYQGSPTPRLEPRKSAFVVTGRDNRFSILISWVRVPTMAILDIGDEW